MSLKFSKPVTRQMNQPWKEERKKRDRYNAAVKRERERAVVHESNATAEEGNQTGQTRMAGQPTCSFRCPLCSRDFVFTNVKTGPVKFAHHVKYCDPEKGRRKSPKKKDEVSRSDSPDNETQVTAYEELSESIPINPDELECGSRVVVIEYGERWKATILRHHIKKNKPGFMIHYDGKKSAAQDWVPTASVVDFIASDLEDSE